MDPKMNDISESIADVDRFCKDSFGAIMQVVRTSHALPKAGDDHEFYCSFTGFQEFVSYQKDKLIKVISLLMKNNGYNSNFSALATSALSDVEDYTDKIVECNDALLERVAALLDSCEKVKSSNEQSDSYASEKPQSSNKVQPNPEVVISSWNRQKKGGHGRTFRLLHAHNIIRPQLSFKDGVDNTNTPFIPKIKVKPHALKPLPQRLLQLNSAAPEKKSIIAPALANLIQSVRSSGEEDQSIYIHPYEYELNTWEPLPGQLDRVEPRKYTPFDQDSCIYVDTPDQLQELLTALKEEKELAFDLEHHSYRSFQGITCLMQISSRTQDYIVDTLALRAGLYILNEVLSDPKIVKVFHGADSDINWLQRDFGLYVVNMFDTGQAARALAMERFSLDFLAQKYCNVQFDKKYQLADWRVRPLPAEMLYYAQGDTHYLLYIYDVMKNELLDKANGETRLLTVVLMRSRDLCLLRYEKSLTTPDSHLQLLERMQRRRGGFKLRSPQQIEALRLLFLWRDGMARREDESPGYVTPNHMLIQIAEILPKEAQGVLACCNPIPPLLRQHVLAVHQLVKDARHCTASKSTAKQPEVETKVPVPAKSEFDSASLLTCPHDLSQVSSNVLPKPSNSESPAKSCNILVEEKSDLVGPFKAKFLKKRIFQSKSDNSVCAFTRKISETDSSSDKLDAIARSFWDPFMLFFPSGVAKKRPRKNPNLPVTLKNMLSGNLPWKMRKLETSKDDDEGELKEVEKAKTFGEKMEISKDAQISTEQQVQVLKTMMSRKKKSRTLPPANTTSTVSMDGMPQALKFRHNDDSLLSQKIRKKSVAPQQKPTPITQLLYDTAPKPEAKRPFQPHRYSKEDYKQFSGGKGKVFKKKKRFFKSKHV